MSKPRSMRSLLRLAFALVLIVLSTNPVEAKRKTVVHRGPRRTVVVHQGFPIRRRLPTVVVHPARYKVAFVPPARFLPVVAWRAPVVVTVPPKDRVIWEDSETFTKDEEWTEISLGAHDRGTALVLDLDGEARFDFAEIVFGNGDSQVVDFNQKKVKRGAFELLNFKDGREVSYVRLVAKAESETARVTLRMLR